MVKFINESLKGFDIKLKTKPGVFSKDGIDSGTKLLVENIEINDGEVIADLGCGSGIIGFVAAKLNPNGHVHLLDVNLRFTELAKVNAELNNLKNTEVFISDLFSAVGDRTYHHILSNPPQHLGNEFLDESVKECLKHLKENGEVIWVVQKHLKPVIERLFNKYFQNCEIIAQNKEHVVLAAVKMISRLRSRQV